MPFTQTSTVLEFHRRISQGYNHLLRESLADLSRFKSLTTPPTDLTFLQDYVQNTINKLVTKAVKIVMMEPENRWSFASDGGVWRISNIVPTEDNWLVQT